MTNPAYSDLINVTFQLGICQNVDSPSSGCTGPSPIFMIRQDNKKCFSLGSLDVATFEQNPFQDGKYNESKLYTHVCLYHILLHE
jgi:hypothetical protein